MKAFTRIKQERSKEVGFSLVELIIVIAIVGVLVAIAIPVYSNFRERAHKSIMTSDLRNAAQQMEIAKADAGEYPRALPANFRSSQGYNVFVKPAAAAGLPAAVQSLQAQMEGVGSTATSPSGVRGTSAFTENSITITLDCPTSRQYTNASTGNPFVVCGWAGSSGPDPVMTMVNTAMVCQAPNGVLDVNTRTGPASSISKPAPAGYAAGSPQTFTIRLADPCFDSTDKLVGFGFNETRETSDRLRLPFAMGLAIAAAPADYCLEANSGKTTQVFSYSKPGGLRDGGC